MAKCTKCGQVPLTKQDKEDLRIGRMAREHAEAAHRRYEEERKKKCQLCGKEKHGGWPCD